MLIEKGLQLVTKQGKMPSRKTRPRFRTSTAARCHFSQPLSPLPPPQPQFFLSASFRFPMVVLWEVAVSYERGPMVVLGGFAVSYEQGIPVRTHAVSVSISA